MPATRICTWTTIFDGAPAPCDRTVDPGDLFCPVCTLMGFRAPYPLSQDQIDQQVRIAEAARIAFEAVCPPTRPCTHIHNGARCNMPVSGRALFCLSCSGADHTAGYDREAMHNMLMSAVYARNEFELKQQRKRATMLHTMMQGAVGASASSANQLPYLGKLTLDADITIENLSHVEGMSSELAAAMREWIDTRSKITLSAVTPTPDTTTVVMQHATVSDTRPEAILNYILEGMRTIPDGQTLGEFLREQKAQIASLTPVQLDSLFRYIEGDHPLVRAPLYLKDNRVIVQL